MKDYIICFAGGPFDGTAQKQEYCGTHAIRLARNTEDEEGPIYRRHVYVFDEVFTLKSKKGKDKHVLIARYKGKQ